MPQWKKGESGNPAGRPRGLTPHEQLRKLLDPHAPQLVEQAVQLALSGDTAALKMCLDRCIPTLKPAQSPIEFDGDGSSLADRGASVLQAMANGQLAPTDTAAILQSLTSQVRLLEETEFRERLERLEASHEKKS